MRYNTETGFWPNYGKLHTESSGQQHQNSISEYKTQHDIKQFNEAKQAKSTEEYSRSNYPHRYDRETQGRDTFKSRSPTKKPELDDEQNQHGVHHRPSYTQSNYAPRHLEDPAKDIRSSQNSYPFTPNYRSKFDMTGLDKPPIYKGINTEQSATAINDVPGANKYTHGNSFTKQNSEPINKQFNYQQSSYDKRD